MSNPLLSVRLMVYNNEQYIIEALESALNQKTNFQYEIVIGDDFSKDKTLDICKEYKLKHPNKIKILNRPINGKYYKKRRDTTHLTNFIDIIENSKGKYIALMDGDDFWTDPFKLQKQVDFLEKHQDYVACAHDVEVLYEDKFERKILFTKKSLDSLNDVAQWFYATSSVVFRKRIIGPKEKAIFRAAKTGGDKILQYICYKQGLTHFFTETMGCYRKSSSGVSFSSRKVASDFISLRKMYFALYNYYSQRYRGFFKKQLLLSQVKANYLFFKNKKYVRFLLGVFKGLSFVQSISDLKLLIKDSMKS